MNRYSSSRWRFGLRVLASLFFVAAGCNHFRDPKFYQNIIPPGLPYPAALVVISGICEIAGGIGLLVRPLRAAAGWGLIALLICVFPANVYMAMSPDPRVRGDFSPWLLWLRLPLQAVIIAWAWFVSARDRSGEKKR
jgi:uncharacterized membrane protein